MIWQTKIVQIESADLQWDGSEESKDVIRSFVPAEYLRFGEIGSDWDYLRIYNILEHQWLNVPIGHWVVKGLKGEFYPCEPSVMEGEGGKYFPVEEGGEAVSLFNLIKGLKAVGESLSGSDYIKESDMVDMGDYLSEIAVRLEKHGVK